jgi:hypothetical protein
VKGLRELSVTFKEKPKDKVTTPNDIPLKYKRFKALFKKELNNNALLKH